jgi:hypothetical protein
LLHLANAERSVGRDFYECKTFLLRRYGRFDGHDMQEIQKECWGYRDDECGPQCRKCGGTGIYSQKWIRLERWKLGNYLFHVPNGTTYSRPDSVQIQGRIEHADYGLKSREAQLWLYLLSGEFLKLLHALRSSCYCYPKWWPMCRFQKLFMTWHLFLAWRKCWCGRWFPTLGRGWCVCGKCRSKSKDVSNVPF